MRNLSLTQLAYIVALEEWKNFGVAAKKCHVSQPTLSMQIQKLEDELGLVLFDRSRQPVVPTDAGRKVIEQARRALADVRAIDDIVLEEKGDVAGEFRLGVIPTIAPYLLPLFVKKFSTSYPKVTLVLEEGLTDQLLSKLKRDELDAAVLATPLEIEFIEETPVFYEPFWVYLSPGHPMLQQKEIRSQALDASDLWLLKEGHCFRTQVLQLCKSRRSAGRESGRSVRLESGNLEVLCALVDQSQGMTLLPELAVRKLSAVEKKRVRPFAHPAPVREVSLIQSRLHSRKRIFDALLNVLRATVPKELLEKPSAKQVMDVVSS